MTEKKSIWRMPVMWLVVGLPLASIIAGVGLVITAVNTGGADSVTDKVDRMSQIQTTDLGPDNQAQVLKLSAILRVDGGQESLHFLELLGAQLLTLRLLLGLLLLLAHGLPLPRVST